MKSYLRISFFFCVVSILMLAAVATAQTPVITATKVDSLVDSAGDTQANPGDTLIYRIVIKNSGTGDAANVNIQEFLDTNMAYIADSLKTSPLAKNDSYLATPNIAIEVTDGPHDLLANDIDLDGVGPALVVSAVQGSAANVGSATATSSSGSVTVASDGTFSYEPPAGFDGNDTFTYTVDDGEGFTNDATVTINVFGDKIWFIDVNGTGSNVGTFSNPFKTIAAFNAAVGPDISHFVSIASGNYIEADGINLKNFQKLIGEGVQLSTYFTATFFSVAAYTTFAGGTSTRPVITTTGGTNNGIDLARNNTIRGLNIGNTTGIGIKENGATAGILTIADVSITGTGGGIEIDNGGTLAVAFDELSASSSTVEGIDLEGVTGNFDVTSGTISTTGVQAIVIDGNSTIDLGVALTSVSANGGTNGITIKDATGSFTVNGTGTTDGSGGTIQNCTVDAVVLNNAQGVTLKNMQINNTNGSTNILSGENAIEMTSCSDIVLNNVDINDTDGDAIRGTTVTNFQFLNSTIQNAGEVPTTSTENGIFFTNVLGTVVFDNSTVTGSITRNVLIENDTGTATINVINSSFNNATREDGFAVIGGSNAGNSANINFNVTDCSFTHNNAVQLKAHSEDNSTIDVNIIGNDFDGDPNTVGNVGIDVAVRDGGNLTFDVIGTLANPQTFQPFRSQVINVFASGGGTASGKVNGNIITESRFGAGIHVVAQVTDVNGFNPGITIEINNNNISNIQGAGLAGIHIEARDGTNGLTGVASVAATVTNNTVTTNGADAAIQVYLSDLNGTANSVCLNATGNATQANGGAFGETDFFFGNDAISGSNSGIAQMQGFSSNVSNTWFTLNGNTSTTSPTPLALGLGPISGGTCSTVP